MINEKILHICNIICNNNEDILIQYLKPYLNIKDMLIDLINNISLIDNANSKTIEIDKNNNRKLYIKENSVEIFENINDDDLLFKTKIGNKIGNIKESINSNNDDTSSKANITKEILSKTGNSFYNKNHKLIYQSPFFTPFKSREIFSPNNKSKTYKKKLPDLNDTNSLLKDLNYQTKALGPTKEYSSNNDLLITDISKEIKQLKNNYNRVLINSNSNDYKNKQLNGFILFKNTALSHSPSQLNYNKKLKINKKNDINKTSYFNKTSAKFHKNNKKQKNINKLSLQIISLKSDKIDKLKKCFSQSETSFKGKIKNKTQSLNDYNIRMYYKPIKYKFGYKQVKDLYKLTEFAALNFAKKRKYDPMSIICKI